MASDILIINDDLNLLSAMKRQLRGRYPLQTAQSGETALEYLSTTQDLPAVILCDMRMGGMNGVETLRRTKDLAPDAVHLMLTGMLLPGIDLAEDVVAQGPIWSWCSRNELRTSDDESEGWKFRSKATSRLQEDSTIFTT